MMKFRSKFSETNLKKFLTQFVLILIICLISYFGADRPLAVLMSKFHSQKGLFGSYDFTTELTSLAYFVVLITMALYAYFRVIRKSNKNESFIAVAGGISLAVPIAFFVKTELQYLWGRTPPHYYGSKTLLFVKRPDLYGFHLFQGGSFPSGHMCVFTAALLMVSFYYPKLKPLSIFCLTLLAGLLLFYNYHFLSDVIAGTYLGYIIAKVIYELSSKSSSL